MPKNVAIICLLPNFFFDEDGVVGGKKFEDGGGVFGTAVLFTFVLEKLGIGGMSVVC